MLYVILYLLTLPAANYLIGHVGTLCVPNGPCLVPVWPDVMAPLTAGIASRRLRNGSSLRQTFSTEG